MYLNLYMPRDKFVKQANKRQSFPAEFEKAQPPSNLSILLILMPCPVTSVDILHSKYLNLKQSLSV